MIFLGISHRGRGVTYDHRMRSLTTTKHFHNRTTENVPWLAHRHAERWSGLPALGVHTCWPILVGGGGVGGMITYHKALPQYYSALQSTTPYYKVLLESTTPVLLCTAPVLLLTKHCAPAVYPNFSQCCACQQK